MAQHVMANNHPMTTKFYRDFMVGAFTEFDTALLLLQDHAKYEGQIFAICCCCAVGMVEIGNCYEGMPTCADAIVV